MLFNKIRQTIQTFHHRQPPDTRAEYKRAALANAQFDKIVNGGWFASIPDFPGLWAAGETWEQASDRLRETLDGWIDVHTKIGCHNLPVVNGITWEDEKD